MPVILALDRQKHNQARSAWNITPLLGHSELQSEILEILSLEGKKNHKRYIRKYFYYQKINKNNLDNSLGLCEKKQFFIYIKIW